MELGILGPMEVRTHSGGVLVPRGTRQRRLLAALLLHAPRAVSLDRLAELVWGRDQPEDARAALRTQVSRLRSFLEEAGGRGDIVASTPHGYRLAVHEVRVDAHRFQELVQECLGAGEPARELTLIDQAMALWRGDPWEELRDHPDFAGAVRSLQELRLGLLERQVHCLVELDRLGEALARAQPLTREDPLRERPRALLMDALYRSGRQHEALAAFQEYRRLLSQELGLDPSPELRELEGRIRRHEPPASPTSHAPTAGRRRTAQEIRFCRTPDGVRLAYAEVGQGLPLVKAANWLNHLEFDWESPVWRRLFRELSDRHTLIRYDERGSGLSDWDPPEQSLDAWVLDLETVVDACGLERFPLLGISQGCAVCIEYAARHPDRVSGLILHGGYAAGWRADPSCPPDEAARRDASIEIIRHGWAEDTPAYRQMFTLTFIPGGRPEEIAWFNELERCSASPENAARFMEAFGHIDVRDRLARVQAPTLVLHSRGDQRIPHDRGRELAAGIPGARFVLLESDNHLILEHEPAFAVWVREATAFLSRTSGQEPEPRGSVRSLKRS